MTRAIERWNHPDALLFGIADQLIHFFLAQSISIWIIVVGFSTFSDSFLDLVTLISLPIGFNSHIIQHEAHTVISDQQVHIRVAQLTSLVDNSLELI